MQSDPAFAADFGDTFANLADALAKIDAGQDALLLNGHSLQGQLEAIMSLLTRLIQLVTPERPEQEGPTLTDLVTRIVEQQAALFDLMKHTLETVVRIERRSLETEGSSGQC